jgi:ABC-type branched-subunit amino acid transport system ATPase component
MSVEILSCRQLSKAFGAVRALIDFSFDFPASGVVGIIGPNGAGKSTLLNVVTGFCKPDSGSCRYRGRELVGSAPHQISSQGIVRSFQELRLITRISAAENVLLAVPKQRREKLLDALFTFDSREEANSRTRSWEMLKSVGIGAKRDSLAGELSYGEQKLLAIACAIAAEGQVLLLDEPVAGVDIKMREWILTLLRNLAAEGRLVVMVEHDIPAIRSVTENVLVLDHGKLVAAGPTDAVLESRGVFEAYVG